VNAKIVEVKVDVVVADRYTELLYLIKKRKKKKKKRKRKKRNFWTKTSIRVRDIDEGDRRSGASMVS
jgi:hypothetical protein